MQSSEHTHISVPRSIEYMDPSSAQFLPHIVLRLIYAYF